MAWQQLMEMCPQCDSPLFADTSTGDVVCLSCDYESGQTLPHVIIEGEH